MCRVHALEVPVQAGEHDQRQQRGRLRVRLRGQQGQGADLRGAPDHPPQIPHHCIPL